MDKKIKVSILGSCVSREMFNYTNEFEVVSTVYTSYISLFEKTIDVSIEDCSLDTISKFEARNAFLEFNKKVFDYLKDHKGDFLLIDFAEVVNEYYLVNKKNSNDIINIKIVATPSVKAILTNKNYDLTRITSSDCNIEKIVGQLFNNLLQIYDKNKIYLIKTSFSNLYIGQDSKLHLFSSHYRLLSKNILRVRKFEDEASKYLNKANIVNFDMNVVANEQHKYGCSPVHYADFEYVYMTKFLQSKIVGGDYKQLMDSPTWELLCYKDFSLSQFINHKYIFESKVDFKLSKFWDGYKLANKICSYELNILYVIVNRHIGDSIRYLRCLKYIKDYYSGSSSECHFNEKNIENKLFKKKKKIDVVHVITKSPLDGVARLYEGIDAITVLDKNDLLQLEYYAASGLALHNNIVCDEDAKRQVLGKWDTDEGAYTRALMFGITDFMWDICIPKSIKFTQMRISAETEKMTNNLIWREGINIDQTIILCPYAQSSSCVGSEYFNKYVENLVKNGFTFYTNVSGNEDAIAGTKPLYVSVDILACLAKKGVRVVGVQSGIIDVISAISPKNLTVLFLIKTSNDRQYAINRNAINEVTKVGDNITYLRIEHFEEDYVLKLLMDNFH